MLLIFLGLTAGVINGVHIDRNIQVTQMFLDQWFHFVPIQSSYACRQAGRGRAMEVNFSLVAILCRAFRA